MRYWRLGVLAALWLAAAMMPQAGTAQSDPVNPPAPGIGDAVTFIDEDDEPVATVTLVSVERDWTSYNASHTPAEDTDYLALTVEVEGLPDSPGVEIDREDFALQVDPGVLVEVAGVRSDTADPPLLRGSIDVEEDDVATFTLVYEIPTGTPVAHLFWTPGDAFLTVAELDGE